MTCQKGIMGIFSVGYALYLKLTPLSFRSMQYIHHICSWLLKRTLYNVMNSGTNYIQEGKIGVIQLTSFICSIEIIILYIKIIHFVLYPSIWEVVLLHRFSHFRWKLPIFKFWSRCFFVSVSLSSSLINKWRPLPSFPFPTCPTPSPRLKGLPSNFLLYLKCFLLQKTHFLAQRTRKCKKGNYNL